MAEEALAQGREVFYQPEKKWYEKSIPFVKKSIAVDAAHSSATGVLEYQGIDLQSGTQVFYQKFSCGTNNIGEFLALVHGLSYLQKEGKSDYALYSDSKIAIGWIYEGKCKTNVQFGEEHCELFSWIQRAETWLKEHRFDTEILKWNTKERGEIPADFGRK